jgi:F0F1-type ATP synthase assembly protein I
MTKRAALLTTTPNNSTGGHTPENHQRQLRIGMELADTTWRIAVPVLLFAGIGIVADRVLGSKPWLTLLGMAIGFVCAGLLVRRQLKRWPDMPVKPGSYERNKKPGDEEDKDYYSD